jgi:hypothetical protein
MLRKIPVGRKILPESARPSHHHRRGNGEILPGAGRPARRDGALCHSVSVKATDDHTPIPSIKSTKTHNSFQFAEKAVQNAKGASPMTSSRYYQSGKSSSRRFAQSLGSRGIIRRRSTLPSECSNRLSKMLTF